MATVEKRPPTPPIALAVTVHVLTVLVFVLTVSWIFIFHKTVAWSPKKGEILVHVWNAHPIFMVAGFVCLFSEAAVAYKLGALMGRSALTSKKIHLSLQAGAVVLGLLGFAFVYKYKVLSGDSHFYSAHSWLGLFSFVLFILQWIGGFVAFFYPVKDVAVRKSFYPWHTYGGVLLYVLLLTTAAMGAQEKIQIMEVHPPGETPRSRWSSEGVFLNSTILITLGLGLTVLYILLVGKGHPTEAVTGGPEEPLLGQ